MKRTLIFLCIAACGTSPPTFDDPDSGTYDDGGAYPDGSAITVDGGADGGINCADECVAPDAGSSGLPLDADCDPLLDECAIGLTCRVINVSGAGICQTVGPLGVSEYCLDVGDAGCGYAMQCHGVAGCLVTCDPIAPGPRCVGNDVCVAWLDNLGYCVEVN